MAEMDISYTNAKTLQTLMLMTNAQDFMAGDHEGNCISSAIFATFILACTNKESIILLL